MRYLIQALAMLGDLMLIAAVLGSIYFSFKNPFLLVITLILIFATFKSWKNTGAFMAWYPKNIKKFLANAKEIGL